MQREIIGVVVKLHIQADFFGPILLLAGFEFMIQNNMFIVIEHS